jgi:Fuseless
MYLYAVVAMAYWRGGWQLLDYCMKDIDYMLGCLAGFFVSYSALLILRCTRTLSFPVFDVYLDTSPNLLVPGTRFQMKVTLCGIHTWVLS